LNFAKNLPESKRVSATRGWSERITRWLFKPHVSITKREEQRQATLLAAFLSGLVILTFLGTALPALFGMSNPLEDPFTYVMGGISIVLSMGYIFSRTRFYNYGAVITVTVLSALPFLLAVTRGDFSAERIPSVLGWLILPLIVGSIFLNVRGVIILALANITAVILFPRFVNQIQFQVIFPPLSLLIVVSTLILILVRNRNQLEQYRLTDLSEKNLELRSLQGSLEERVKNRTTSLEKRLIQLRTAAEISRSIGAVLDPDELLTQVVNLIQKGFNLYYVGLFLIDKNNNYAVLQSGTGIPGRNMISEGHKLAVGGSSMIGWATASKKPRIALDVGKDAVRFENPHLPYTRSELALPLIIGNEVLGALSIQSTESEAFDEDDLTILQGIADSLAIAINNARLFQQVQENLAEINTLHRSYLTDSWSETSLPTSIHSITVENEPTDNGREEPLSTFEVPMTLREQVIGQLTFAAQKTDLSPEETAFIEAVTTQASIALENARLLEETKRRVERERVVSEVSNKLWATSDVDNIIQIGIREIGRVLNASEGIIKLSVRDESHITQE
jgi:GAF domain-containing protein